MKTRASIDLGTNTCLLLIQSFQKDAWVTVHDESQVVRLGEGLSQTRMFQANAMDRTLQCLKGFLTHLKHHQVPVSEVVAVCTASGRNAQNSAVFFARVKDETGLLFRVITGDEEAWATFYGAAKEVTEVSHQVVLDIGGGSTELAFLMGQGDLKTLSLPIGAVKITEQFLKLDPVSDTEFWEAEDAIDLELRKHCEWANVLLESNPTKQLVAVAGTAVSLSMMNLALERYDPHRLDQSILTRGDLHRWVEELKYRTIIERKQIPGIEAKRADVLLAGALIFWRVMEVFGFRDAKISTRGLRYGVLELQKESKNHSKAQD